MRRYKLFFWLIFAVLSSDYLIATASASDDGIQEQINTLQNRTWYGYGAANANLNDMAQVSMLRSQQNINRYNMFRGDCGCCCCEPGIKRTITCLLVVTLVGGVILSLAHLLHHS